MLECCVTASFLLAAGPVWIKFLTDDSAPHESKHTQIHVSLQEHRRRFLISSSHSFWWKAAQVTDFCHFLETNIWFDSTIRRFLCVFVFPLFFSQLWSNDTPESVGRLWPHHSRRRAVSPVPRKGNFCKDASHCKQGFSITSVTKQKRQTPTYCM